MKVYISGPITGCPELNEPAFLRAERLLVAAGHDVVNPHKVIPAAADPQWADYMRADLKQMLDCDAVACLPWSDRSRGSRIEAELAQALGMTVRDIDWFLMRYIDGSDPQVNP